MKFLKTLAKLTFLIALTGCSSFTVSNKSLISQLNENQKIEKNLYFQKFAIIDYPSNNLLKIKCVDKKGNNVWLYPDKNTELVMVKKSNGKKVKAYFDTVISQNDTLYGLRSRLLGGLRIIPINDIEKVKIHAEFPIIVKTNE